MNLTNKLERALKLWDALNRILKDFDGPYPHVTFERDGIDTDEYGIRVKIEGNEYCVWIYPDYDYEYVETDRVIIVKSSAIASDERVKNIANKITEFIWKEEGI